MVGRPHQCSLTLALLNSSSSSSLFFQGTNISLYSEVNSSRNSLESSQQEDVLFIIYVFFPKCYFWFCLDVSSSTVQLITLLLFNIFKYYIQERNYIKKVLFLIKKFNSFQIFTSKSRIGNWSVDVGGSALFWPQGAGLQVQANLDRSEKIWLNGTLEGGCLKTAAGYMHRKLYFNQTVIKATEKTIAMTPQMTLCPAPGHCEDLSVMACMGTNHTLVLDVQTSENCSKSKSLGQVSAVTSDKKLILTVSGCLESLTAAEV